MDIPPYVIQSRSKLSSKSYIFMEYDKIISLTNLLQHLLSAKEQTNSKVSSDILPLYKASS